MTDPVRNEFERETLPSIFDPTPERVQDHWQTWQEAWAASRAALSAQPADPKHSLSVQMQQMCSDWGTYWRAQDAHGVDLTQAQALELLRFALGVEVEIKNPAEPAALSAQPVAFLFVNGHRGRQAMPLDVKAWESLPHGTRLYARGQA